MSKPFTKAEIEIDALEKIVLILQGFEEKEQHRMLKYLVSRFGPRLILIEKGQESLRGEEDKTAA